MNETYSVEWKGYNLAEVRESFPTAFVQAGTSNLELIFGGLVMLAAVGDLLHYDGEKITIIKQETTDEP